MRLLDNLGEFSPSVDRHPTSAKKIKWDERSEPGVVGFFPLQTTLGYLCPPVFSFPYNTIGSLFTG